MKTNSIRTSLFISALMAHVTVAGTLILSEDFTTDTTGNWSFAGESTLTGGEFGGLGYLGASGDSWGFGPHDGLMRWRPEHTGTSSNQATLIWQELDPGVTENASDYTLSTTGIHAGHSATNIYLAIQFEDGSSQWAVSDQSIRTSSGTSAPIAGSWDLSSLTFSSLDFANLLGGHGSGVSASTVLENASGIGIYSRFENRSWMANDGTYVDSFTVIPEPGTLVLVGVALGAGLVFRRRRK